MPKYNKNSAQLITEESLVALSKTYRRMIKRLLPIALKVIKFKAKNASAQTASSENLTIFKTNVIEGINFVGMTASALVVSVEFYDIVAKYEYSIPFAELASDAWKEDFVAKEALLKAKEATLSRKQKKAN